MAFSRPTHRPLFLMRSFARFARAVTRSGMVSGEGGPRAALAVAPNLARYWFTTAREVEQGAAADRARGVAAMLKASIAPSVASHASRIEAWRFGNSRAGSSVSSASKGAPGAGPPDFSMATSWSRAAAISSRDRPTTAPPSTPAEAQVAAVADDVAYNHHDLHDGLRAELFTEAELAELPVVGPAFAEVDRLYPGLDPTRRRYEALRRVFGVMVEDVIAVAQNRLAGLQPQSAQEIRDMDGPIIRFSKPLYQNIKAIKSFLFQRMYRAPSVMQERARVTQVVRDLFPLFMNEPALLPVEWQVDVARATDETQLARVVLDYVAGMTDRFALQEHARLFGETA